MSVEERLALYGYWRSSAAYRVRIALNLKGLGYDRLPVHLIKAGGAQHGGDFRTVNPQGLVPVLRHGHQLLNQSLAICEYLEERFPRYPLLPADRIARARVRSLALQVACEIHPLNNLRVQKYLKTCFGDAFRPVEWMTHWMAEGFEAIELQLTDPGTQQFGTAAGNPGLFECFLVPQAYNAERYGIDLSPYPVIQGIVAECRELAAFRDAAPENQSDAEPG